MISLLLVSVLAAAPPAATTLADRLARSESERRAGRLDDALKALEDAEAKASTPVERLRVRLQRARCTYYRNSLAGSAQDAVIVELGAIAREAEPVGDDALLADARDQLGLALYGRDFRATDHAEARALFEQALAIRRAAADQRAIAESLFHLGLTWENKKDATSAEKARARALYQEALGIAEKGGFDVEASYAVRHIAGQKQEAGDLDGAVAGFERSLALREKAGYRIYVAPALLALGDVWKDKGNLGKARWYLERARLEADRIQAARFRAMADEAITALDALEAASSRP
jgi:tetratricopeptide (TPR) repeat protein